MAIMDDGYRGNADIYMAPGGQPAERVHCPGSEPGVEGERGAWQELDEHLVEPETRCVRAVLYPDAAAP